MTTEQQNRMRAWIAIADLFLDSPLDMDWIVSELQETGYSRKALFSIYADEVAPQLYRNLNSVAGMWGAWDEETFTRFKPFQKRWYHAIPFLLKFNRLRVTYNSISDWKEIEKRIEPVSTRR